MSMSRKAIRFFTGLGSGLLLAALTAGPALAQADYPPTEAPTGVAPPAADEGAEVAFTGADITLWMVLLVGLVVVGILALFAARRRSKTAA